MIRNGQLNTFNEIVGTECLHDIQTCNPISLCEGEGESSRVDIFFRFTLVTHVGRELKECPWRFKISRKKVVTSSIIWTVDIYPKRSTCYLERLRQCLRYSKFGLGRCVHQHQKAHLQFFLLHQQSRSIRGGFCFLQQTFEKPEPDVDSAHRDRSISGAELFAHRLKDSRVFCFSIRGRGPFVPKRGEQTDKCQPGEERVQCAEFVSEYSPRLAFFKGSKVPIQRPGGDYKRSADPKENDKARLLTHIGAKLLHASRCYHQLPHLERPQYEPRAESIHDARLGSTARPLR